MIAINKIYYDLKVKSTEMPNTPYSDRSFAFKPTDIEATQRKSIFLINKNDN